MIYLKKNKKKEFFSKFERFMYKLCIFVIILLILGIVCGQTTLAKINLEVQKLNKKVTQQENVNESLDMKIDEMTSLDNIKEVSEEYGLSYNSDNIKTIE